MLNINGDEDFNQSTDPGASFYTFSKVLDVTSGAGFTQVINNSSLVVQPTPFYAFVTDTLSLRLGGKVQMAGGSAAATFILRSSVTGYITGYGTIGLTASSGTGLDSAGTIAPAGGDLNIIATNAKLDLDGNSAGADLGG